MSIHKDQYARMLMPLGPIVYFHVMSRPVVLLNTLDTAVELLDRRAVSTSARPLWIIANKLTGGQFLPFIDSRTHL